MSLAPFRMAVTVARRPWNNTVAMPRPLLWLLRNLFEIMSHFPFSITIKAITLCLFVFAGPAIANEAEFILRPVDTSSPRATLESVQQEMKLAFQSFLQGKRDIQQFVRRASRTLDLSEIPPALREREEVESMYLLIDILDRMESISPEEVPGADEVANDQLDRWNLRDTDIVIARIEDGPRAGEFLFSKETVARLKEFYDRVRPFPKRESAIIPVGAYEFYRSGVNTVFSPSFINALPRWLRKDFLGEPAWKWPPLLLLVAVVVIIAILLIRLRPVRSDIRDDDIGLDITVRRLAAPMFLVLASLFISYFSTRHLRITGTTFDLLIIGTRILLILSTAYILNLGIKLIGEIVIKSMHTRRASFDSQLVRLGFRLLFWIITIFAFTIMAENIGMPVAALAASLGVGGLAVALAAQSTLENLVAGLTIYGDRPVRIGDLCSVGGTSGRVESIGLRSTRLRTLERTLVTIPNADVAKQVLENFSVRDRMLFRTTIGLRYETTPDQMRYVLGKLRELAYGHPKVLEEDMRIRFSDLGTSSLDVELFFYVKAIVLPDFMEIKEDLLLRIMDIVEQAGTGFAFPAQTAYLAKDKGLDEDKVRAAEAQVDLWRESGELPFPDLNEVERDRVRDRLDYPKGS